VGKVTDASLAPNNMNYARSVTSRFVKQDYQTGRTRYSSFGPPGTSGGKIWGRTLRAFEVL